MHEQGGVQDAAVLLHNNMRAPTADTCHPSRGVCRLWRVRRLRRRRGAPRLTPPRLAVLPAARQKEKRESKRREIQAEVTRLEQRLRDEKTRRKRVELDKTYKVGRRMCFAGGHSGEASPPCTCPRRPLCSWGRRDSGRAAVLQKKPRRW
jgi:hypothetical protein